MSFWLSLFNNLSVSIFGSVLSASFCDAWNTRTKRWIFWLSIALIPILQSYFYSLWTEEMLRQIYPLIVHLPLLLLLIVLTGKVLGSLCSILTAYLCCQLRRWIALFIVAVLSGGEMMQNAAELIITVPLLLLVLRFVSPVMRQTLSRSLKTQWTFTLIPALYYGFDYLTRIYTELLSKGAPVAVEFMPFVCCAAYLVFLLYNSAEQQARSQLELIQNSLDLQLTQAVREINIMRESHSLTRQYRHDLRHHLQYISACIENGQTDQAQTYISAINEEIKAQEIRQYCENEAANLILSAFDGRAQQDGIKLKVQGKLPAFITMPDKDLCVLLSNALENALNACRSLPFEAERVIDVQFFVKENKTFMQITNPCSHNVRFADGIPVTDQEGHGIGVQSICAIVQRYHGVYTFHVQDGKFILRLSF